MTEQSLTTTNQFDDVALAAFGLGDGELKPSYLQLIQNINQDRDKPAGTFYDAQSKFYFSKLTLIPLSFDEGRVYFASEELGVKPLCRSNDGIFPVLGDPDLVPQAQSCAKCPKAQFKKINGKTIKAPCANTAALLFMDADTGIPYRYKTKRGGTAAIKNFKTSLQKVLLMSKAQGKPLSPLHLQVELKAQKITDKQGRAWYEPEFGALHPVQDPAKVQAAFQLFTALKNKNYQDDEESAVDSAVNQVVSNGVQDDNPPFDV